LNVLSEAHIVANCIKHLGVTVG